MIGVLKDVDPGKKCFRLVGGVLVERTVSDVLPALQHNNNQVWRRGGGEEGVCREEGMRRVWEDGRECACENDEGRGWGRCDKWVGEM